MGFISSAVSVGLGKIRVLALYAARRFRGFTLLHSCGVSPKCNSTTPLYWPQHRFTCFGSVAVPTLEYTPKS